MKNDDRMNEKKAHDTEDDCERVDVFGDNSHIGGTSHEDILECLPDVVTVRIGDEPRADCGEREYRKYKSKKDRDNAPMMTFILVLLLTTAMTAGAYVTANELGGDPRATFGRLAAMFMFGLEHTDAKTKIDLPYDSGSAAEHPTDYSDAIDKNPQSVSDGAFSSDSEPSEITEEETIVTSTVAPGTVSLSDTDFTDSSDEYFVDLVDSGISPSDLSEKLGEEILDRLNGGGVIVVCAHPSESFGDGVNVTCAAEAMIQALSAVGVDAYICDGLFDANGRIGSYSRALAAINSMAEGKNIGLVIDIHTGDEPGMLVGWDAAYTRLPNVALANMVNDELGNYAVTLTVGNGNLNQSAPWLSLHIELDSADTSSRGMRTARIFADAVIRLFRKADREA